MMTRDDLADLGDGGDHPVLTMIRDTFPIYIDIWREFFDLVGFPMDDVIAVALAVDPTICAMTEPLFVDVVLSNGTARGQTAAYRGRQLLPGGGQRTTRICTDIDGRRFMKMFRETIVRYRSSASKGEPLGAGTGQR
jgi:purine nucleosidase